MAVRPVLRMGDPRLLERSREVERFDTAATLAEESAIVVLGDEDGYADRSFGNLPEVQTIMSGELNSYDILVNDWLVFTDETLPATSAPVRVCNSWSRPRPSAPWATSQP